MRARTVSGLSAIALAVLFNIPYALLVAVFDYPAVLRRPAGEVLARFAEGGPTLVLIWYGFTLAALALIPVSIMLAATPHRLRTRPALVIGAAITGALAGLAQAIGLARWVFAVPALASAFVDPLTTPGERLAAEHGLALINAWGGIAIGEHIGQLLTAAFVAQLALLQRADGNRLAASTGNATAALLALGTGEGVAIALGGSGAWFASATIAGFLCLTAWLVVSGIALLGPRLTHR